MIMAPKRYGVHATEGWLLIFFLVFPKPKEGGCAFISSSSEEKSPFHRAPIALHRMHMRHSAGTVLRYSYITSTVEILTSPRKEGHELNV